MKSDAEFLEMLKAAFKVEAEEHVQALTAGLLEMEETPTETRRGEIIETILREAHSLKGAARAVDYKDIEHQCQWMEEVFLSWKADGAAPSQEVFNQLSKVMDRLGSIVNGEAVDEAAPAPTTEPEAAAAPPVVVEKVTSNDALASKATSNGTAHPAGNDAPSEKPNQGTPASSPNANETPPDKPKGEPSPHKATTDTVRISTWKLDDLFLHAEEFLSAKLAFSQRSSDLSDILSLLEQWQKRASGIEPTLRSLRSFKQGEHSFTHEETAVLTRVEEFLESAQGTFKQLRGRLSLFARATQQDQRIFGGMVTDLLDKTKHLMLLPCSGLLNICPKLVRDISKAQGKEIDLSVHGQGVEIDKRILEEMRDPLLHLLRNGIDHGIERPEDRVKAGKPPVAKLKISVCGLEGNRVEILVQDDGRGIDVEKVKEKAVNAGSVSQEQAAAMSDSEAAALIFQSGVSTSASVTEISGRGLGMAIVWEHVVKLGGHIAIETAPGQGTTFRISLPISIATLEGVVVRAGGELLVIPSSNVQSVTRVDKASIRWLANQPTVFLNNHNLALVALEDVLALPKTQEENAKYKVVVVVQHGDSQIALAVSAILNEHEVLVKPLGYPLVKVRNVAGVTVLGSGKPALVLRVSDLFLSSKSLPVSVAVKQREQAKRVLVAEDSITSRMLLKNILEMGGFQVATAVDGADAWSILNSGHFDALVTDVDMPRMSGFELTSKVRQDAKLRDLPVLLVTARETQADRERGGDVGASAYIVKRSFEESNLLDVLGKLI